MVSRVSAPVLLAVRVDVHLRVVVPRVAPFFAGRAKRVFFVLQLLRLRVGVRGGELDVAILSRPEERARGLAKTRRDAFGVAAVEIERVDLIEGIAGLALALKDEALAVRRPVALAGALAFDGEPPDAREEVALLVSRSRGLERQGTERERERQGSTQFSHRQAHGFNALSTIIQPADPRRFEAIK